MILDVVTGAAERTRIEIRGCRDQLRHRRRARRVGRERPDRIRDRAGRISDVLRCDRDHAAHQVVQFRETPLEGVEAVRMVPELVDLAGHLSSATYDLLVLIGELDDRAKGTSRSDKGRPSDRRRGFPDRTTRTSALVEVGQASGRRVGNRTTSRIDVTPANSITSRSIPIPRPAVGGNPYSNARR